MHAALGRYRAFVIDAPVSPLGTIKTTNCDCKSPRYSDTAKKTPALSNSAKAPAGVVLAVRALLQTWAPLVDPWHWRRVVRWSLCVHPRSLVAHNELATPTQPARARRRKGSRLLWPQRKWPLCAYTPTAGSSRSSIPVSMSRWARGHCAQLRVLRFPIDAAGTPGGSRGHEKGIGGGTFKRSAALWLTWWWWYAGEVHALGSMPVDPFPS